MVHLRILSPPDRTQAVLDVLFGEPAVCNVVVFEGAARRPTGDVVLADVAREDASVVISELRDLGLEHDGSIAVEVAESVISDRAKRASRRARGEESDAVIWEEVEERTSESATLSGSFALFMGLAACIASAGILVDSEVLIVGAMVVGPEFGPLAGLCVALVQRRRGLAIRSLVALALGLPLAALVAGALSGVLIAAGLEPAAFDPDRGIARLISSPDAYTAIVAVAAGVAGMLSLTTAKSGALIGVLISVTTMPAVAAIGVGAATGDAAFAAGAAAQLGLNVVLIVLAGTATLAVQRAAYERRRRRLTASGRARPTPRAWPARGRSPRP